MFAHTGVHAYTCACTCTCTCTVHVQYMYMCVHNSTKQATVIGATCTYFQNNKIIFNGKKKKKVCGFCPTCRSASKSVWWHTFFLGNLYFVANKWNTYICTCTYIYMYMYYTYMYIHTYMYRYTCTCIVLARGVSGCLLDTLFQFWTPYLICHLHVNI